MNHVVWDSESTYNTSEVCNAEKVDNQSYAVKCNYLCDLVNKDPYLKCNIAYVKDQPDHWTTTTTNRLP